MAKNPNNKPKPVKGNDSMNGAMKFFLAGCVAELYLLTIRRFYINGTLEQVVAWDSYLKYFSIGGAVIALLGLALAVLRKEHRSQRELGWYVLGLGAFCGAVSFLVRMNLSVLTLLYVAVPVAIVACLLWVLYDRECALTLTILSVSLLALWAARRGVSSMYTGIYIKAAAVAYILLLAGVAWAVNKACHNGGNLGKYQVLPASAEPGHAYLACGLSAAAMVTVLVSPFISYYAMWLLAGVLFALAVYYTVKQL